MARVQKDNVPRDTIKGRTSRKGTLNDAANVDAPNGTQWVNSNIPVPEPGSLQAAHGSVMNGKGSIQP